MSKRQRQRRDILEDLETAGKPLEVVLLAWGIIEMHSTSALLRAYGLSTQNPKSKWVIDLIVSTKLKLLNLMELLSDTEFNIIQQFKKKRDGLAHRDRLFFPNYNEAEKNKLTDMAIAAADVAHDLSERTLRLPSPHERNSPKKNEQSNLTGPTSVVNPNRKRVSRCQPCLAVSPPPIQRRDAETMAIAIQHATTSACAPVIGPETQDIRDWTWRVDGRTVPLATSR
jgi:hypothetical protein